LFRSFKDRIVNAPLLGAWSALGHPAVAAILARSGVDWLVLDSEHGMFSAETLRTCLDAAQTYDLPTLVRVPANDPTVIKLILDLGPDGVVIPMVNTASEAAAAVASCLYPPAGRRGFGAGRAAGYGMDYPEYQATANRSIAVIVQIEHFEAVANVDEIARVPGLTGLFIGPTDLSASMGLLGQDDHPRMVDAISRVLDAGQRAGLPVGMFCASEEQAIQRIGQGAKFVAWTNDLALLARSAATSAGLIREALRLDLAAGSTRDA
jgi:2-keto-3-deoxy-L-rhamnonate aldolase RhmA